MIVLYILIIQIRLYSSVYSLLWCLCLTVLSYAAALHAAAALLLATRLHPTCMLARTPIPSTRLYCTHACTHACPLTLRTVLVLTLIQLLMTTTDDN